MDNLIESQSTISPMVTEIRRILDEARGHIAHQVNSELLYAIGI